MKTAERSQLTPEQVARFPRPGMAIPGDIRYSPDAKLVTYLFSERGDLVRDLWALDLASGRKQRFLSPPGETVTEEEIRRHCEGQISYFKIPQHIRFVDGFPMTVTGKIQKFKIREIETKERGLERLAARETA